MYKSDTYTATKMLLRKIKEDLNKWTDAPFSGTESSVLIDVIANMSILLKLG